MKLRLELPFKSIHAIQGEMYNWVGVRGLEVIYYPNGVLGHNDRTTWQLRNTQTRDILLSTNDETELVVKLFALAVAYEEQRERNLDRYR